MMKERNAVAAYLNAESFSRDQGNIGYGPIIGLNSSISKCIAYLSIPLLESYICGYITLV